MLTDNRAASPGLSAEPALTSTSFEPRYTAAFDTLEPNKEQQ